MLHLQIYVFKNGHNCETLHNICFVRKWKKYRGISNTSVQHVMNRCSPTWNINSTVHAERIQRTGTMVPSSVGQAAVQQFGHPPSHSQMPLLEMSL